MKYEVSREVAEQLWKKSNGSISEFSKLISYPSSAANYILYYYGFIVSKLDKISDEDFIEVFESNTVEETARIFNTRIYYVAARADLLGLNRKLPSKDEGKRCVTYNCPSLVDEVKLRQLVEDGKTYKEIAEYFDVSKASITRAMSYFGLSTRRSPSNEDLLSDAKAVYDKVGALTVSAYSRFGKYGYTTLRSRFGSISKVKDLVGVTSKVNEQRLFFNWLSSQVDLEMRLDYNSFEWLLSPKGYKMHVDCFMPDIGLIIEYDDISHFKPVKMLGGEEGLKLRQARDAQKDILIPSHGFYFIRFPYTLDWSLDNLQNLLDSKSIPIRFNDYRKHVTVEKNPAYGSK